MTDRRDLIAQRRAGNIDGEKALQDSFGRSALEKMGWQDGSGVGKREGVTAPLKVKRLRQDAGLGRSNEEGVTDAWIENVTGFSDVLSKLGAAFNQPKVKEEGAKEAEKKKELKSVGVVSQKRLKAKNMRSFSRADLTAIMGGTPCGEPEVVKKEEPEVQETAFGGMFVKAKNKL